MVQIRTLAYYVAKITQVSNYYLMIDKIEAQANCQNKPALSTYILATIDQFPVIKHKKPHDLKIKPKLIPVIGQTLLGSSTIKGLHILPQSRSSMVVTTSDGHSLMNYARNSGFESKHHIEQHSTVKAMARKDCIIEFRMVHIAIYDKDRNEIWKDDKALVVFDEKYPIIIDGDLAMFATPKSELIRLNLQKALTPKGP